MSWLENREAAVRSSHDPADLGTIMRPYNPPEGYSDHKIMIVMVQADDQTEGGIIIPGMAKVKTGEAVVVDLGGLTTPLNIGLHLGQRVQVAKYMGSSVELRERWVDQEGNEQHVTREYITLAAGHILNAFVDPGELE